MAKEKLTMDEVYTCPRCGSQTVRVGEMEQIFDDARSEDVACIKCGSSWRVFYKMTEFNTKVLNITDTPIVDDNESTPPITVGDEGVLEVTSDSDETSDEIKKYAAAQLGVDPLMLEEIPCEVVTDDVVNTDCHVVNEDGTKPGLVEE